MNNNKKYTAPELEIIDLDCEDIIQTSNIQSETDGEVSGKPGIFSTGTATEVETDFFK